MQLNPTLRKSIDPSTPSLNTRSLPDSACQVMTNIVQKCGTHLWLIVLSITTTQQLNRNAKWKRLSNSSTMSSLSQDGDPPSSQGTISFFGHVKVTTTSWDISDKTTKFGIATTKLLSSKSTDPTTQPLRKSSVTFVVSSLIDYFVCWS